MTAHILVVDVEPAARKQTKSVLEQTNFNLAFKPSFREALLYLKQHGQSVELVLLSMPQDLSEGLSFITQFSQMGLDVPVITQMGQGNLADVAEVMRAGAFDFMVRPVSRERLLGAVKAALKVSRAGKNRVARRSRSHQFQFSSIISASQSMMRVVSLARKAAYNHIPIVLEGETGVGKMLMARAIHSASDRSSKPFVVVDCAGFAADESGSRAEDHLALWRAKIEEAEGATLYFNEVGYLSARFQSKLLELAQAGQGAGPRLSAGNGRSSTRIISSSSRDLIEEVRSGRFRDDLYYRLNVFPIAIAPLRRRKEDIPHLARMFTEHFASEQRKTRAPALSASAMALLTEFDWPGNIRQLENALYRAVTLSERNELTEADFPQIVAQLPVGAHQVSATSGPELVISNIVAGYSDISKGEERGVKVNSLRQNHPDKGAISSINDEGELRPLAEIEEELIRFALRFYRGQMSQVARKLGIGRSTLYRKLKDYGIDPDNPLRDVA